MRRSSRDSHGWFVHPVNQAISAVVICAFLWLLGQGLTMTFGLFAMRIVMLSGIAIILAVSLNIVNGFAGQFSLGHAGFYMIGAYAAAALTNFLGAAIISDLTTSLRLPTMAANVILMILAIFVGAAAAAAAGVVVGLPTLRLRGDYLAIATLGFGEAIRVMIQNANVVGGPRGFAVDNLYTSFTLLFAFVILVILFSRNLAMSSHGRALFAIRDDEIAAESAGVNIFRYKLMAFAVSAAWAGVAGALFAHYEGLLVPDSFGFMKSVDIVVMVVLGGSGSITGSAGAAVAVTALPMLMQDYLPDNFQSSRMVLYAAVLVILMLTRPQGILGRSELSLGRLLKREPHPVSGGSR